MPYILNLEDNGGPDYRGLVQPMSLNQTSPRWMGVLVIGSGL